MERARELQEMAADSDTEYTDSPEAHRYGGGKRFLWVFGSAVQDITVEVDIERLSREYVNIGDKIRMAERGPEIASDLELRTQVGSEEFQVHVRLQDLKPTKKMYLLRGGEKYALRGDIESPPRPGTGEPLFLPCENRSWGGGGANVVTFLRALAPGAKKVPIKYTDIAMSRSLPLLVRHFWDIRNRLKKGLTEPDLNDSLLAKRLKELYDKNPVQAEAITNEIAGKAAEYSPERSLEVYLASLPVEGVLYRPKVPQRRRNWVFSRFRSASNEVDNKIILKGTHTALPDDEEASIAKLLRAHKDGVGAFLLNSLRDAPLFRAAYKLYREMYEKDEKTVAVLAMTDAMQKFTKWMLQNTPRDKKLPPFILILNETEAKNLAEKFGAKVEPFMKEGDLPNIKKFAKIIVAIQKRFDIERTPRIYVTLGRRGSLGVDGGGNVVYVSSFSKGGATIFDTNACGDAYCAAIALLEWAKRHVEDNIANVNHRTDALASAKEMGYFIAVATAAAYCKATNRRGKVYAADVKDLLLHNHLASEFLPIVSELLQLTPEKCPDCVDENFRLRVPAKASFIGVTEQLSRLIS